MITALRMFANLIFVARLRNPGAPDPQDFEDLTARLSKVGGPIPTKMDHLANLLVALRDGDPKAWRNFLQTIAWDKTSDEKGPEVPQEVIALFLSLAPPEVAQENLNYDPAMALRIRTEHSREWNARNPGGSHGRSQRRSPSFNEEGPRYSSFEELLARTRSQGLFY